MPLHIHPVLRSLEKAEEAEGLIKVLNSVGYTVQSAAEAAGKVPTPPLPAGIGYIIRGTVHQHSR